MKPSWNDAPEWARYLARDRDGSWCWFEEMPRTGYEEWLPRKGKALNINDDIQDWRETLETRP